MSTLAADIGGTKFTLAIFEGDRMAERESRLTVRTEGPEWMLRQIEEITAKWKHRYSIDACGVGFGGPVDFSE